MPSTPPTSAASATDFSAFPVVRYGPEDQQYATLSIPDTPGPHPVVVLVHGGFWRTPFGPDLMEPLADDLVARGFATWNITYRRVGEPGGGYPGTLHDVADAVDTLAELAADYSLDLDRVGVVGHSAGGHLALWTGSRSLLPDGAPGANPVVNPTLVVGQAAVVDLIGGAEANLGRGAVQDFLGGEPSSVPENYAVAQPDISVTDVLLVTGDNDTNVPADQSTQFDTTVEVFVAAGEDHFSVIDPASESWAVVVEALLVMAATAS